MPTDSTIQNNWEDFYHYNDLIHATQLITEHVSNIRIQKDDEVLFDGRIPYKALKPQKSFCPVMVQRALYLRTECAEEAVFEASFESEDFDISKSVSYTHLDVYKRQGIHINEDTFYPETVHPETKKQVPDGEEGELVFTTLSKEGIPLLRYNTRDLSTLNREKCSCGRTSVRMKKITGRSDDMLIIRGVNLFPSQIEHVLLEMGETSAHYMLYIDKVNNLDTLELKVELDESRLVDTIRELQTLSLIHI